MIDCKYGIERDASYLPSFSIVVMDASGGKTYKKGLGDGSNIRFMDRSRIFLSKISMT